ncbi:MAG TPA: hypothetical protein VMD78_11825 [Candidatus Baltobacteraceae bacterium]|nr:hypothetical protein [Candidatus Baltobacteraceae bacterium]
MAYLEMVMGDSSEKELGEALFEGDSFTRQKEAIRITRNIRSVGFISKPGETQVLKACIEGPVLDHLRKVPGFAGVMILHSQKESRNLWVLTFWDAENQAATTSWEKFPVIRKLLAPLIDVCTKVRTFEATLADCGPQVATNGRIGGSASVC